MAVKRGGLGKGLDTLIPSSNKTVNSNITKEEEKVITPEALIDIQKIEPNREQPRKKFDDDALLELSDSIKQFGVLQPLIVQDKKEFYEIIAGERRWRAAKMAGLSKVPVIIRTYTEMERVEIGLIENIQREDLNPIEEAAAYKKLIQEYDLKQDEIAERVSKSRTAIANSMRLLKLDERVQQMVIDEMISTGHARALLAVEDKDTQYALANKIFDEKLSVRETEKLMKKLLSDKEEKKIVEVSEAESLTYKKIEEKIQEIIGAKVKINRKSNNKGKIEIDYYSAEELERIMELFTTIK